MKDFGFKLPTEVVFGVDTIIQVGERTANLGTHALVVCGKGSVHRTGLLERVQGLLQQAGVKVTVFDQVEPNPRTTTVDQGASLCRELGCDVIVGLGGGSAMDAAKAIAVAAANSGSIWDYIPLTDKEAINPQAALPILTITTTSGTGSHCNPIFVLTNPETQQKPGCAFPNLTFPQIAIVDPKLMTTVPPKVTAATGLDIFFHVFEAYVSRRANPMGDMVAEKAMSLVGQWLKVAYQEPNNLEARYWLAWADTLAGISLATTGVVMIHALEHPVSARLDVTHGEGLAALATAFVQYNFDSAPERFIQVAKHLGQTATNKEECVAVIKDLLASVNLDITLADLGLSESDLDWLVADTLITGAGGLLNNPRPMTPQDVREVFRLALGQ